MKEWGRYNLEANNVVSLYQKPEFYKNLDLVLKNNKKSELKENGDKIIELIKGQEIR